MAKHTEHGYGYYPGGDPRKFSPDPECSTEEERARHKSACEAWDRGDTPDPGGPHIPIGTPLPEGTEPVTTNPACGHITVAHYGLGTYTFEYDCDGPETCHDCAFDELTRLRTENQRLAQESTELRASRDGAHAKCLGAIEANDGWHQEVIKLRASLSGRTVSCGGCEAARARALEEAAAVCDAYAKATEAGYRSFKAPWRHLTAVKLAKDIRALSTRIQQGGPRAVQCSRCGLATVPERPVCSDCQQGGERAPEAVCEACGGTGKFPSYDDEGSFHDCRRCKPSTPGETERVEGHDFYTCETPGNECAECQAIDREDRTEAPTPSPGEER